MQKTLSRIATAYHVDNAVRLVALCGCGSAKHRSLLHCSSELRRTRGRDMQRLSPERPEADDKDTGMFLLRPTCLDRLTKQGAEMGDVVSAELRVGECYRNMSMTGPPRNMKNGQQMLHQRQTDGQTDRHRNATE